MTTILGAAYERVDTFFIPSCLKQSLIASMNQSLTLNKSWRSHNTAICFVYDIVILLNTLSRLKTKTTDVKPFDRQFAFIAC